MPFLVLLPVIPAIWCIATRSLSDALLDVFLPVLLFVPSYYEYEIPHFMPVNAWEAALFPIVFVGLIKYRKRWRFQRSDLWILLFVIGAGMAEGRYGFSRGLRAFFVALLSAFAPYVVGKVMIEGEGLRERFVRRLIWLGAIVAVVGVLEFRLAKNLFVDAGTILFAEQSPFHVQPRGGWMRVEGPYGSAIYTGMIFGALWLLSLWLHSADKENLGPRAPKLFGIPISFLLICSLLAGLFMTLSRGPWMGAAAAFGISFIGSAKHVKRALILVLLLGSIVGGGVYSYLNAYTSIDISDAKTPEQENAIYRRLLLSNYVPIIKEGGVFGWGQEFPRVEGQPSIDNEYLWMQLTQGSWGFYLFLMLAGESCLALIVTAKRTREKQEFYFILSLLAALVSMLVTLTTVNLGSQAYQLLFLLYGWGLSVQPQRSRAAVPAAVAEDYRFRRIYA